MLNICIRYARDREEAKDMLQEGYIRVFKNIHQFNFKGSFEGWMKRVMVTTCINIFRKNSISNITDYVNNESLLILENAQASMHCLELLSGMNQEELLGLISKLPPVYRMIFNMNVIEGYSHKEIAETLGINESTSRSNLAKARFKLQEMLNIQDHERTVSHAK